MRLLPTFLILFTACASRQIIPAADRTFEHISVTKASKAEAFDRVLVYLAKRLDDANSAIKLKDPAAGRIIAQGRVLRCSPLTGLLTAFGHTTDFSLDVTVKDKKIRIIFDDVRIHAATSSGVYYLHGPWEKPEVVAAHAKCLIPLRDELIATVNGAGPLDQRTNDF